MSGKITSKIVFFSAVVVFSGYSFVGHAKVSACKKNPVDQALRRFARATSGLARVFHQAEAPDRVTGLGVVGKILQTTVSFKKSLIYRQEAFDMQPHEQEDSIAFFMNLVVQVSRFQSVPQGSLLAQFAQSDVRSDMRPLFLATVLDANKSSELMRDFFGVVRSEVETEVAALDQGDVPQEALGKVKEFFQNVFGLALWKDAFLVWVNFFVDSAQVLMNSCIDTFQEGIHSSINAYEESYPLLGSIIEQAEPVLQSQIDLLQSQVNTLIDDAQGEHKDTPGEAVVVDLSAQEAVIENN